MSNTSARLDRLVNRLVKNYTLWIFIGLLVLFVIAVFVWHFVFPVGPEPAVYGSMHLLDEGWPDGPRPGESRREKFYQTSQGNLVIPFSWFMSLERQPQGFPPRLGQVDLFSSPSVQARYGLLPDTSIYNPYQLPVGIVKDVLADEAVDVLGEGHREWIGISCAACHTGQLLYRGNAVRIDGGQSMWNFTRWSTDLVGNLTLTATLPDRFDRFAKRVFRRDGLKDTPAERGRLRQSMKVYLNSPLITQAIDASFNNTYPAVEGPARTAALGRGVNGEFGLLDPRNIKQNRGPVSYPPLWYTHDFDWVQSVAAIHQPLGRNITEAWGVSVRVKLDQPNRYLSTARVQDLFWIETLLSVMKAPPWPEQVLGRLDPEKIKRGHYLYEEAVWNLALPPEKEQLDAGNGVAPPNPTRLPKGLCARCHAPALAAGKDAYGNRNIQLPLYRLDVIGTDPYDAQEFAARKPYTGILADDFGGQTQVANVGVALETMINGIENKWYRDRTIPKTCQEIMNGFRPNLFRAPLGYPARPLAGYWATAPYLHNGSVRTLYQLLSPVDQRDPAFYMGTFEFDPGEVGYRSQKIDGSFKFDTRIKGNSNAGHEFRDASKGTPGVIGPYLSPEDRMAIVEYLKWMNDIDASGIITPQVLAQRQQVLNVLRDQYEGLGSWLYTAADRPGKSPLQLCRELEAIVGNPSPGPNATGSYLASPAPAFASPPPPAGVQR